MKLNLQILSAVSVVALLTVPVACGKNSRNEGPSGEISTSVSSAKVIPATAALESFVLQSAVWNQVIIPVCWETSGRDTEKNWVRTAIAGSWEAHSVIRFTGWQSCSSDSKGIRIVVEDIAPDGLGPHTKALGRYLDGKRNGMSLNFDFEVWGTACKGINREYCIKSIAIHEFGHALGFDHENNRTDRDVNCKDNPQDINGDYYVTVYDPNSVMNYCADFWKQQGKLSDLDIVGLQKVYDKALPLNAYHPGCTGDAGTPECMAAMHRKCLLTHLGNASYPQEYGDNEVGHMCAATNFYGLVSTNKLPGCDSNPRSNLCVASGRRYCEQIGKGGAGIVQEVGNGEVALACIPTAWQSIVGVKELTAQIAGCQKSSDGQSPACTAPAHRYCLNKGLEFGGIIMELDSDEVLLGCVNKSNYTITKIK